jgi:hypothetical protein
VLAISVVTVAATKIDCGDTSAGTYSEYCGESGTDGIGLRSAIGAFTPAVLMAVAGAISVTRRSYLMLLLAALVMVMVGVLLPAWLTSI